MKYELLLVNRLLFCSNNYIDEIIGKRSQRPLVCFLLVCPELAVRLNKRNRRKETNLITEAEPKSGLTLACPSVPPSLPPSFRLTAAAGGRRSPLSFVSSCNLTRSECGASLNCRLDRSTLGEWKEVPEHAKAAPRFLPNQSNICSQTTSKTVLRAVPKEKMKLQTGPQHGC